MNNTPKKIVFIPTIEEHARIKHAVEDIMKILRTLNQTETTYTIQIIMEEYTRATGILFQYEQTPPEEP